MNDRNSLADRLSYTLSDRCYVWLLVLVLLLFFFFVRRPFILFLCVIVSTEKKRKEKKDTSFKLSLFDLLNLFLSFRMAFKWIVRKYSINVQCNRQSNGICVQFLSFYVSYLLLMKSFSKGKKPFFSTKKNCTILWIRTHATTHKKQPNSAREKEIENENNKKKQQDIKTKRSESTKIML